MMNTLEQRKRNQMMCVATESLKVHEGCRLDLYECTAGKTTVGYGHNIEDNGISLATAEVILTEDMQVSIEELENCHWYLSLDYVRQAVLVDMNFNMGFPTLCKFKNMIAALEVKDFERAALEMLDSGWARQVGNRSISLSDTMRTGVSKYDI